MEHNVSTDDSKNDQPVQPQSEFKKSINTWTNRRASSQMKRVAQMNRNREIHDMMHIMNEDSGKKASEVSEQMKIYSNKTKANQRDINSFTPTKAFYIMGHGYIVHETFTVPEGRIVVVKVAEGELFYQMNKYFPIIYDMDLSILTDPIRRRAELVEALGSVAIYYPGDLCPNFKYNVVDNIPSGNQQFLSEFGSGVTDMSLYKEDRHKCTLTGSLMDDTLSKFKGIKARNNREEIKQFILDAYQHSIYPTPQEVETVINTLNSSINIDGIISSMKRNSLFIITQKDLCDKFPGVYYNFVCRPNELFKPMIKKILNNGFVVNKLKNNVKGILTLENSPDPFHSPNNIKSYSETSKRNRLQKLQEAKNELQVALHNYDSTTYGKPGTPQYNAWTKAHNKKNAAIIKVKILENNATRKILQMHLGESHVFRRPGIRNMIASTTTNAKLLQKYRDELEVVPLEREQNEVLRKQKEQLELSAIQRTKNENDLSKIQSRINNITQKIGKNGEENKNNLFNEKNQLEKEYEKIKGFMFSNEGLMKLRSNKVRNIEQKYDTWIQFLKREIAALTRAQRRAHSDGGRSRSRRTRKR